MIGTRRRQERASSSFSSTCTTVSSNNARWSDVSSTSPTHPAVSSPQRTNLRFARRFILPLAPAAWLPVCQTSPRAPLHDLCSPRQEPRPPADVLNRSSLGSCSPSLAKFSRTTPSQHISTSTSTTTLPSSAIQPGTFLHPTMSYLTVNGLRSHHHHHHHHNCRHAR